MNESSNHTFEKMNEWIF